MKDPAFPFYAQDFLIGTMYLDFSDTGRYIKLLAYQWDNNNIPKKRLGLLVGLSWDSFSEDLREKFSEDENSIWNERLEIERTKRLQYKEKQAINGSKGGRPKAKEKPNETQIQTQTKAKKKPLEDESEQENKFILSSFSSEFLKVWDELIEMPKWKKKPLSSIQKSLTQLKRYDESFAIGLIEKAIAGNYQGVVFSNTDEEYLKSKQKSNEQTFNNSTNNGKLAGTYQAAEDLAAEVREKSKRFEERMQNTG